MIGYERMICRGELYEIRCTEMALGHIGVDGKA
jgi:hypothetical protein